MNLEDLGVLLEDLVDAQRRQAVALEELASLAQVALEAFTEPNETTVPLFESEP